MNGTKAGNGTGAFTGGIPLNVTLHSWPVPKLQPDHKQFNHSGTIRNGDGAKNFTNRLHNLNATGYVAIDEDLTDTGFTDVQTLILAGIATLIPLLIGVAVILGIRFLWRKYRERKCEGYEGVLQREESSDPSKKAGLRNLPLELKGSESQLSVNGGGEVTTGSSPQVLTPKSNGSVITMTLKNNHLIVETEETDGTLQGIKVESQGTSTKYVTQAAPDFRVNASANGITQGGTRCQENEDSDDHRAIVHLQFKDSEEEMDRESCNTGLSQSDLSVSSAESQNPSYRYGNQTGYDSGGYGYPEYSGYATVVDGKTTSNTKGPKEGKPSLTFRSHSMMERENSLCAAVIPADQQPDVLQSDIEARATRLEEAEEDERYQEEQRALGNGEVSPNTAVQSKSGESVCDPKSQAKALPGKITRCEQLKTEISPAEEVERYPVNNVNNASGNITDS